LAMSLTSSSSLSRFASRDLLKQRKAPPSIRRGIPTPSPLFSAVEEPSKDRTVGAAFFPLRSMKGQMKTFFPRAGGNALRPLPFPLSFEYPDDDLPLPGREKPFLPERIECEAGASLLIERDLRRSSEILFSPLFLRALDL